MTQTHDASSAPGTVHRHTCPYCKAALPSASLKCPSCGEDLEDWINLEHVDLQDVRTLKVVLSEYIKRYVWRKTITTLISGGVLVTVIGYFWTVYEKAQLSEATQARQVAEGERKQAEKERASAEDATRMIKIQNQIDEQVRTKLNESMVDVNKQMGDLTREIEKARDRLVTEMDGIRRGTVGLETELRARSESALVWAKRLETSYAESERIESEIRKGYTDFLGASEEIKKGIRDIKAGLEANREQLQTGVGQLESFREKTEQLRASLVNEEAKIGELIGRFELERTKLGDAETTIERQRDALARSVSYEALLRILEAPDKAAVIARLQAEQKAPRIDIVRPFSPSLNDRKTVLGGNVRLEWFNPGILPEGYRYIVQVSGQPGFPLGASFEEMRQLATYDLTYKKVQEYNLGNTIYWRVALKNLAEPSDAALEWTETGVFDYYPTTLDRIRSTGKLLVGISASYDGKFSYEKDGARQGFEIELAQMIARDLLKDEGRQLQVTFVPYDWGVLLSSLKDQKVDVLLATISIKTSREVTYGLKFTEAYYNLSTSLVYAKDARPADIKNLGQHPVAVQANTVSVPIARRLSTNVRETSSTLAALEELSSGRVYAAIMDAPFAEHQIAQQNLGDRLTQDVIEPDYYGMAVPAGEAELLARMNVLIKQYKDNGELAKLAARTLGAQ
jgi:ABC-type amino acid transport substrate-binding protein